jgi:predicted extracellular nuclease
MFLSQRSPAAVCALICLLAGAGGVRAQAAPDPQAVAIGTLQGRGERSPLEGRRATVEAVVSLLIDEGRGGFFAQDGGDGDAATSDGVRVIAAHDGVPGVRIGDRVRVRGLVIEDQEADRRGGVTTLRAERIDTLGRGALAPPLRLTAPPQDWEAREGMRVRIDAPLSLNGTNRRYAETIASFGGRLWTPTELAAPRSAQIAKLESDNARRRLLLDDASSQRDPPRVRYLPDGVPRSGSAARGAEGAIDQRNGAYRLQLGAALRVEPALRPAAPRVGGNVRVAVFNLENLFNGDGRGGGFPTPRGAKTPAQLQAQTGKLVATLRALDADIAALMELENDGYGPQSSLAQFVDALNAGGGDWRFVDARQGPGQDEIRVGLIYRTGKVTPVDNPAVLEGGPFGQRSRVPLAQAFRRGDGPTLVVVANHFKSKGCSEATGADADQRDGQGCWNALRLLSAQWLDAWLKTDPTGHGAALTLLTGDLNAYALEDPVRALRTAGWVDAFAAAKAKQPYSYVYNGQAGRLDHALLSPALAQRLRGAAVWHSNADEPDIAGEATTPWRSSDHDPMLLGFDL